MERLLQALSERNAEEIAQMWIQAVEELKEKEIAYNSKLLTLLNLEDRTALDKQEKKALTEDSELKQLHDEITKLKAFVKACSIAMDALKLSVRREVLQ